MVKYATVIRLKGDEHVMNITDEARDLLKQLFEERNASGVRVYFGGFG